MDGVAERAARFYVYYPFALLVLVLGLYALVCAGKSRRTLSYVVVGCGMLLLLLKTTFLENAFVDFNFLLAGGDVVRRGEDPYKLAQMPFPPTVLGVFAALSSLPRKGVMVAWLFASVVVTVCLVPLARRCLILQSGTNRFDLDGPALWVLTTIFSVSVSLDVAIKEGNLSVLVTFCILLALLFQSQGRGVLSGVCLAVATFKPQTLLPFLILFLRKSDLRTWIALAVASLLLCAAGSPISELPDRFRGEFAMVARLSDVGKVNDYSFPGLVNQSIVGFNRLVYCLGLRDRVMISWVQTALVAVFGIWLVSLALQPKRFPRDTLYSLIALYSMLFFYHRHYDLPILALPLVYTASRLRSSQTLERRLCLAALVIMLATMYIHPMSVELVVRKLSAGKPVLERLCQALLLPYTIWAILISMACLAIATIKSTVADSDTSQLANAPEIR